MIVAAKDFVCETVGGFVKSWDEFFFAPMSPLSIGVFRFKFGFVAFFMYLIRATHWRAYFTDAGFIPTQTATQFIPEFFRPTLTWFPVTDGGMLTAQIVFLVAIFLLMIGCWARVCAVIAFLLHIAFIQRNYSICYGADFISTFFFFALIFVDSDRVFSLRAWLRSRRTKKAPVATVANGSATQILATVGLRLVQLQMCIIYAFTGLEKMKGPSWWDGTAVWAVLGNPQLLIFDLSFLGRFPVVIAVMTFLTLFFEIYFAALVWIPRTRKWILALGIMLHLGIAFSIGLIFFSAVMLSSYATFVDPEWLKRVCLRVGFPKNLLEES